MGSTAWFALAVLAPITVVTIAAILAGYELEVRVTRATGRRGRIRFRGGDDEH